MSWLLTFKAHKAAPLSLYAYPKRNLASSLGPEEQVLHLQGPDLPYSSLRAAPHYIYSSVKHCEQGTDWPVSATHTHSLIQILNI